MQDLPAQFRKTVIGNWGEEGKKWLQELPAILKKCQSLWHLKEEESAFKLSYNYVVPVQREDGSKAVLKIGYPDEELLNEMKTLTVLDGRCTARLFHADKELGAMLLERIHPGTTLKIIQKKDDEEATKIALDLIKNFPMPVPRGMKLPTVAKWTEVFERVKKKKNSPLPLHVLEKAQSLFMALEQSKKTDALLHGDLHHDNILLDEKRGWLSIDPKGVIGEPLFNAARLLNNPHPSLMEMQNPRKVTERRLEILSSGLQADKKRLAACAYVDCILSACWWIESGGKTVNYSLQCAEIFDALLR